MARPSFWSLKPPWCQPWTILLTGVLAVAASWVLLQLRWLTLAVGVLVALWWGLFLVAVPAAYNRAADAEAAEGEAGGRSADP